MITYKRINKQNLTNNEFIGLAKELYRINTLIDRKKQTENQFVYQLNKLIKNNGEIFISYENNKIIGGLYGKIIEKKPFNTFEILHFFVDPKSQKKGIGTKLFFRTIAQITNKLKINSIYAIHPTENTTKIIKKLCGKYPLSKDNTKKRIFNTNYTYDYMDIYRDFFTAESKKITKTRKHTNFK